MSWDGYNFEDAIIISERLVKNDTYTSIHIEEFEIEIRETKLGKEEFTRDIPNVSPKALANLDENGIVRIGTFVVPGDILVGKVSPKSQERADARREAAARDLRPGRRGREERQPGSAVRRRGHRHRHAALQPPGQHDRGGDARRSTRSRRRSRTASTSMIADQFRSLIARAGRRPGQEGAQGPVTSKPLAADKDDKVGRRAGGRVQARPPRHPQSPDTASTRQEIYGRHQRAHPGFLLDEKERKLNSLKRGDELPSGVQQMVKVYVATKRQISVGDKMAGRHGNKGVISKILPEEDMPYPGRRHAGGHPAQPAGRAEPHERGPDSGDAPGLGGRRSSASRRSRRSSTGPPRRKSASASRKPASPRRGKIVPVRRPHRRALRAAGDGRLHLHAEAAPPGGRQGPRPGDGPVLADHAAAAGRQGPLRRPALRRNGSVGAGSLRGRLHLAGAADGEVRRRRGPDQDLRVDGQGREHAGGRHAGQLRRADQRDPRPGAEHAAGKEARSEQPSCRPRRAARRRSATTRLLELRAIASEHDSSTRLARSGGRP